jgi:hypothetical protein
MGFATSPAESVVVRGNLRLPPVSLMERGNLRFPLPPLQGDTKLELNFKNAVIFEFLLAKISHKQLNSRRLYCTD